VICSFHFFFFLLLRLNECMSKASTPRARYHKTPECEALRQTDNTIRCNLDPRTIVSLDWVQLYQEYMQYSMAFNRSINQPRNRPSKNSRFLPAAFFQNPPWRIMHRQRWRHTRIQSPFHPSFSHQSTDCSPVYFCCGILVHSNSTVLLIL
jgi:hypothetical protein